MAVRSTWKGTVSFGLVNVPCKLYRATQDNAVHFNQIHSTCGARIRLKKVCENGHEVESHEIAKGYAVSKEEYVVLTDDDFDQLPLPSKHEISVERFVPEESVDTLTYEKSYYLAPEDVGRHGYGLLRQAMRDSGKVGIARIAFRGEREHLCVVRPREDYMVLHALVWPDEVRKPEFVGVGDEASPEELAMANLLIDSLSGEFEPEAFSDGYRAALEKRIEDKLAGLPTTEGPAPKTPHAADLMAALKASVAATGKKKPTPRKAPARKAPAKKAPVKAS